jgi:hypothetical protein
MGKVMNIIGKFEKIFHFIYGIAQKIHFSERNELIITKKQ